MRASPSSRLLVPSGCVGFKGTVYGGTVKKLELARVAIPGPVGFLICDNTAEVLVTELFELSIPMLAAARTYPCPLPSRQMAGCRISPRVPYLRIPNQVKPAEVGVLASRLVLGMDSSVGPTRLELVSNMSAER